MGATYINTQPQPMARPYRCANCAIDFAWNPVRLHGQEFCCVGCANGGPCSCDYDTPPAFGAAPISMEAQRVAKRSSGSAAAAAQTTTGGTPSVASKIRPVGDRVVVKPSAKEETSKGGIIIPDTAKEKPQEGIVIAVGAGKVLDNGERSKMELKEGDKVLFAKYGGTEFKHEGDDLLVMRESDILAVLAQ